MANGQDAMDGRALQGGTASDVEESASILQAVFAVSFRDVQRYRLSGTKPLITGMAIVAGQCRRDGVRKRYVVNRETIHVEFLVIEDRFVHHNPFEHEHEHRCAEHEQEEEEIRLGFQCQNLFICRNLLRNTAFCGVTVQGAASIELSSRLHQISIYAR